MPESNRALLLSAVLALSVSAFASGASAANIVEAAKADGHFTKLLAANEAAGTSGLLQGPGPFTVFAPNDDAFAKAPQTKLNKLMQPEMKTMLKVTLANHVVTGFVDQAALEKALDQSDAVVVMAANTMPLVFKREGGGITVNGAHVIRGPMKVDNGLVYVIDAVLIPAMPLQPHY